MKKYKILPGVMFLFLLASCAPKIPFTQAIREQYKLSPEEMKGIQYYLSDPVALRRGETNENQKSTEDGKLVVESGRSIDQVTIKANTEGAMEQAVDLKTITVAFEEGAEKQLVFSSNRSRNGYYTLQALSWENGRGKINYGGQTWYSNPGSDKAILLFKMKSIRKLRVNEKVARGRKVN
ncbi:MAG: hypothetical protein JNL88_02225 [Bacteroidia bacterium]|nr:hypothetical protein [Bacteroidia bacterium]